MPQIERDCPSCSGTASYSFNDAVTDGCLRWSGVLCCDVCKNPLQDDCYGFLPMDLRGVELETNGTWGINLTPNGGGTSSILKVLRSTLNLNMPAAKAYLGYLPGPLGMWTKAEAQWLAQKFEAAHIAAVPVRVEA